MDRAGTAYPGADLIEAGLRDLRQGLDTVPALLLLVGAPRLRRVGVPVPVRDVGDPEQRLYAALAAADPDSAHSRYNALVRRLVSYERAAECGA